MNLTKEQIETLNQITAGKVAQQRAVAQANETFHDQMTVLVSRERALWFELIKDHDLDTNENTYTVIFDTPETAHIEKIDNQILPETAST